MRPTLLQHAAAWSPLIPGLAGLAGLAAPGRTTAARGWIAAWCLLLVVQDALSFLSGALGLNNLWMAYIFWPIVSGVVLWALARWHPDSAAQTALRVAVPLVVIVSVVFTVTIDSPNNFSLIVAPFHSIVILLASMWTFVSLSLKAESQVYREGWFWIIGGVMLYAATATAIQPLGWYLVRERVDLLHAAFNVRAAVVLLAFGAITWGMLSRRTRISSGGSSSPPSSPSSSSSAA